MENQRYASQIRARLETYVKPVIGHLPIADIGLYETSRCWSRSNKRPTANRIRKHLEGAINWAIAEGHRTDKSNPAEVKRLQFSLSFAERKVTHYPSLPYSRSRAPRGIAQAGRRQGPGARIRHAYRRTRRRYLRWRQGARRADEWRTSICRVNYGPSRTPRWASRMSWRSAIRPSCCSPGCGAFVIRQPTMSFRARSAAQ